MNLLKIPCISLLILALAGCSPAAAPAATAPAAAAASPTSPPACPVTAPNGDTPPNENASALYLGNGKLWTALWPDGKVLIPRENTKFDGSMEMKRPWWRGVKGALEITGHRLDDASQILDAYIPDGYGEDGFQATGLIFSGPGCWEVTGKVGDQALTFVIDVIKVQDG
jgi:hypothetical protein